MAGKVLRIEFPSAGLVMGEMARAHPGSAFDMILETSQAADGDLHLTSLVLVTGLPEPAFRAMVAQLGERYAQAEILREQPKEGTWVFRTRMPLKRIQSPTLRFLVRFQEEFTVPWSHMAGDRCVLRCEAMDGVTAEQMVPRLESFFRAGKLDAKIEISEPDKREKAAHETLRKAAKQ